MSWTDRFHFPVRFQGFTGGLWQTAFLALDAIDLNFRLDSYHFATDGVEKWRIVDVAGNAWEVSESAIRDYHESQTESVSRAVAPLLPFALSSPTNALETATELLEGAWRARHYAILPQSTVQIGASGLDAIILTEFDDSVAARVCPFPQNDVDTVTVTAWHTPQVGFSVSLDIDQRIADFLALVCAAVIRDFWVAVRIHHAPPDFTSQTHKATRRVGTGKHRRRVKEKTVIYLPRFQIDLHSYKEQSARQIERTVRVEISPHWVSGHIRRLPDGHNVSPEASANATEFGFRLLEGETFVRPFERGAVEQLRTYRSRSAFKLLFGR